MKQQFVKPTQNAKIYLNRTIETIHKLERQNPNRTDQYNETDIDILLNLNDVRTSEFIHSRIRLLKLS